MAANIELREMDGELIGSFVENTTLEGIAWHNLGRHYDRPLTTIEALEGCRANYNVSLQPMATLTDDMLNVINSDSALITESTLRAMVAKLKEQIIEGKKATMRNDLNTTLGIVSDKYGIVQNADAFQFIDDFCTGGDGSPCVESAGVLGHGERVFITAKFPKPIILNHKNNDIVDMYIVFTTSHDGTGCCSAMVTPIRVVCQNTLNAAFKHNSGRWNVRHTLNVGDKMGNIAEASRALKLYDVYREEFETKMNLLQSIRVQEKETERIIAKAMLSNANFKLYVDNGFNWRTSDDISTRSKNQLDGIMQSMHKGIGQDMCDEGTAYWVYNGLTTFFQNDFKHRDKESKFKSIMDGSVYDKQQEVFNELILKAC